jgi:hypothetical protein
VSGRRKWESGIRKWECGSGKLKAERKSAKSMAGKKISNRMISKEGILSDLARCVDENLNDRIP